MRAVAGLVALRRGRRGRVRPVRTGLQVDLDDADVTAAADHQRREADLAISTYLENAGVTGAPVAPDKLTDLTVTVPQPPGWKPYFNPNLSPGTRTIAKGDTYPTAMLLVFQLDGNFDVAEALKHANGDAELSENFKQLNASTDNFRGFPSSMIEGSYDLNGQRMQSYNRIVFADGHAGTPEPARPDLPGPAHRDRRSPTRRRPTGPTSRRSSRASRSPAEVGRRSIAWRA